MKNDYDVICFSHLRWDFVFQRPQHLLSRLSAERRVLFFEEPKLGAHQARLDVSVDGGVHVVVPHLPDGLDAEERLLVQRRLLNSLVAEQRIRQIAAWYYTPMALAFSRHLRPLVTIYDCMDELSAFSGAPTGLQLLEAEFMKRADVVFTGGHHLYEAKRSMHRNIYPMPSSVDRAHFAEARTRAPSDEPSDQAGIAHPRAGFFGVIDERMNCPSSRQSPRCARSCSSS